MVDMHSIEEMTARIVQEFEPERRSPLAVHTI
jgi:hypothetical protein